MDPRDNAASMSSCFINPFANHSYFTVRALAATAPVVVFCPPLQLQFLFHRWCCSDLSFARLPLSARFFSTVSLFAFLLFRARLVGHDWYLLVFRFLLLRFLQQIPFELRFIYYQDYVSDLLAEHYPNALRICELIIATDPSQPNYRSTLAAISDSTIVVLPSPSLLNLIDQSMPTPFLAPYGGNKIQYQSTAFIANRSRNFGPPLSHTFNSPRANVIRIVARSHSYRKGADIFLRSLELLNQLLVCGTSSAVVDVYICGSIIEAEMRDEFKRVTNVLRSDSRIRVQARQYQPTNYALLLSSADLFVMPSRLESTSLAALEALWFGVPSVLTPQCGVDLFVEDRHGLQLVPNHPANLAQAIYALSTSSDLREHCRSCLVEDRHLFSWIQYFTSYQEILAPHMFPC